LSILQPIVDLMVAMMNFFYGITASYGIAIILLTVVIKAFLFPLTYKQTKSMFDMQKVAPQVKAIQDKYSKKKNTPENQQQMNAEIMALYKEHKINPAAGCLPILLQMPFLFALFIALRDYHFAQNAGFLWLESLAATNDIPMTILVAVTTYISMKSTPSTGQNQQMQNMMYIVMPLFIGWISLQFPAGLSLYWSVSNLITLLQNQLIFKRQPTVVKEEAK